MVTCSVTTILMKITFNDIVDFFLKDCYIVKQTFGDEEYRKSKTKDFKF